MTILKMGPMDDFEEGGDGGFPAKVSKKSKRKVPKYPSTVSTNSRKRGDWKFYVSRITQSYAMVKKRNKFEKVSGRQLKGCLSCRASEPN